MSLTNDKLIREMQDIRDRLITICNQLGANLIHDHSERTKRIHEIQVAVCKHFNVNIKSLLHDDRGRQKVCDARAVAIYLSRLAYLNMTSSALGDLFNRTEASINYTLRSMFNLHEADYLVHETKVLIKQLNIANETNAKHDSHAS